jgi:hypothetical protein
LETKDIGEVIATRKLRIIGEKEQDVTILIGKPRRLPDSPDYYCPFQITGMDPEEVRCAYGVDAVQAIQLALVHIGAHLSGSKEAKTGQLRWEDMSDLGFPIPE